MQRRIWFATLVVVLAGSLVLAACAPAATPTVAPAQPTTAPEQPTSAPVQPTAAPVQPTAAPTAVEVSKTGGRITVIDTTGYYTTDPYFTPWFTLTQGAIYDALITTNLEYNGYVGVLAKSWDIAPDGLTVTFHLRDDVKFQDGTPFDAAAAKWNLDNYMDPAFGAVSQPNWIQHVTEFQAPDKTTLVVKMKDSYAPLFSDLLVGYMVSPTAYQKEGKDNFGRHPVGTGPWIAKEIVENDHILYTRNPDYKWGPSFMDNPGPVYPDELMIKYLPDEQVAYASLETGEADIIALPAQFLEKAKSNPALAVNKGIDSATEYLGFNDSQPPFTDKDFRLAVAYAVNRDEIIQAAYEGQAFPLYSALAPSILQYDDAQNEYARQAQPFDPEKSKALLAGLGYKTGADGFLIGKDGKPLLLKFNFPPGDDIKRAAETIQAQLAEVGIKVELGPMENAAIADMLNKCTQQFFMRAYGLPDAGIISGVFLSEKMYKGNRNCWSDPETDKLIQKADTTLDPAARKTAIDALVTYLTDNRPHIPLWASFLYTAYRTEVKDIKFDKPGGYYLMDAYVVRSK